MYNNRAGSASLTFIASRESIIISHQETIIAISGISYERIVQEKILGAS